MGREQIASTAPLRVRDISEKAFAKTSGRLRFVFNEAANNEAPAEKIRLWNKFIPLTPKTALKILSRDLPRSMTITLTLEDDGSGRISLHADDKFSDDGSFALKQKLLDAGSVGVEDGHKGKGYGRTLFRNQVEFFYACGVRKFEIMAALENGGYTWARVGFLPDSVRSDDFRDYCLKPARDSARVLAPLLTREEKERLQKILRPRCRKDFWKIADAPIDLGPRLKNVFNAAAGEGGVSECKAEKARLFLAALAEHFSVDLFEYMKERAARGESVNFGRLLLTGTSWSGSLDMRDPDQMRRLADYSGGFRYLKIG